MIAEDNAPSLEESPAPQGRRGRRVVCCLLGVLLGSISIWAIFSSTLLGVTALSWLRSALILMPWTAAGLVLLLRLTGRPRWYPGSFLAGVLLAWPIAGLGHSAWSKHLAEPWYRVPFEAAAWRENEWGPGWDTRRRMVQDLIDSGRLHGRTAAEVRTLLGNEDDQITRGLHYLVGNGSAHQVRAPFYRALVVHLTDEERVTLATLEWVLRRHAPGMKFRFEAIQEARPVLQ